MGVVLKVAQDPLVETPYKSESFHYFLLEPDQWNHIIWEIPQVVRHKVEAVEFHYRIHGREPGVALSARFEIDRLRFFRRPARKARDSDKTEWFKKVIYRPDCFSGQVGSYQWYRQIGCS